MTLDKDAEMLCDFGLTLNQAKVYLAALQLGLACVGKISKESKIRREDVYRTLPTLEKLGLIEKTLGTPTRVKARPLEKALSVLMNSQRTKLSRLKTEKEELLKKHQKTWKEPNLAEEEENQFVLLSERELILSKIMLMMKKATEQVDIISTSENFFQYLPSYARPLKKTINKGVKVQVRVILDMERSKDSIGRIQEKVKAIPSGAPVQIEYSYDSLNPLVIVDGKEVLMGTYVKQVFGVGESPYLWSTNQTLAGLLQKSFEEQWHHSVSPNGIVTKLVTDKAKTLVEQLRPMDHVMFLYETQEAKHNVLFNYIEAGLKNREISAYVASEENPDQIRDAMKRFGIDVERHEDKGALRIFSYDEIYIVDGKFSFSATTDRWKSLFDEAQSKGFKGLRVAGEMGCFFKHNLLNELAEYEQALHRVFELPMIGICAYKTDMFTQAKNPVSLYNELIRDHRMVLFASIDNRIRKYEFRSS